MILELDLVATELLIVQTLWAGERLQDCNVNLDAAAHSHCRRGKLPTKSPQRNCMTFSNNRWPDNHTSASQIAAATASTAVVESSHATPKILSGTHHVIQLYHRLHHAPLPPSWMSADARPSLCLRRWLRLSNWLPDTALVHAYHCPCCSHSRLTGFLEALCTQALCRHGGSAD